jgi:hypothetical protein
MKASIMSMPADRLEMAVGGTNFEYWRESPIPFRRLDRGAGQAG